MKPSPGTLAAMLIACSFLVSCHPALYKVSCYPPIGSPGDVVLVSLSRPQATARATVMIGKQNAMIMASSDTTINIMIPPADPQSTTLSVKIGKSIASTPFTVDQPSTVRLWFTIKDTTMNFVKSQASNETFSQNNSYSDNRLMYEIFDKSDKILARGYINNPLEWEVPTADKKGLSRVEQKREVPFSVNVPALSGMYKIRFSAINASTAYKPRQVNEILLTGLNR